MFIKMKLLIENIKLSSHKLCGDNKWPSHHLEKKNKGNSRKALTK